jgi:hypothetical protein
MIIFYINDQILFKTTGREGWGSLNGIVSRDWGGLLVVLLDRSEV